MSSNTFFKKLINVGLNILIVLFCIVLFISIYNSIQVRVLKNSYASFFGYSIFEVQTGSMEPKINAGDWVVVKYAKDYELDDIVTYKKDDAFITHRVIEAYKETFVTQGDANNAKDEAISKDKIVGKVVKILPNFGIIRNVILNPVVLIALIISLYLVASILKTRKKNNEDGVVDVSLFSKLKELFKSEKQEEKLIETAPIKMLEEEKEETIKPEETYENVNLIEEIEDEHTDEDDLDKTMYFRMMSVDKDEIDKAYLKLLEKESKKREKEKAQSKAVKTKEVKVEKVKISKDASEELEMLSKRKKKFKNIIEKVMYIKEEEINGIIDILDDNDKSLRNVATIKSSLIKSYIDAKYYNYCGDINVSYTKKNMITKLTKSISDSGEKLVSEYKGPDKEYEVKVKKYVRLLTLVLHLEEAFLVKEGIQIKRDSYKEKILKYKKKEVFEGPILKKMVNDIIALQKKYGSMVKISLEKLETNMFALQYSEVAKNLTAINLKHNISFSKVYSDYIVDKTYSEGVVAEDKMAVLLTLLSGEIAKNILNGDFDHKYLIYIAEDLYTKSNKLGNVFEKFEDEYAKHCSVILIRYEFLSKNIKVIKSLIKEGFKFAVDLSGTTEVKAKDMGAIELMSYVFIDKRTKEKKEMVATLSKELQKKVVYDEVLSKLGCKGGE